MKKKLASAIISVFLVMLPFISFAKTAISDNELDAVSAEAGVTLDYGTSAGIQINNFAPSVISYGDSNGFTGYTAYGWFGMKDISMDPDISFIRLNDLMTIDVGSSGAVTKLNIGLPMGTLTADSIEATIKLDTKKDLTDAQPLLGTFYMQKLINYLNIDYTSGSAVSKNESITISSHPSTQGISIGFNNVTLGVPSVFVTYVSWGDDNGFGTTYTSDGYFGVKRLRLGNKANLTNTSTELVTLSGVMDIDVGTSGTRTALNVVLPTIQIGAIDVNAPLALGSSYDFSDNQQLLGTMDMRGFKTNITGNMQIYSH